MYITTKNFFPDFTKEVSDTQHGFLSSRRENSVYKKGAKGVNQDYREVLAMDTLG